MHSETPSRACEPESSKFPCAPSEAGEGYLKNLIEAQHLCIQRLELEVAQARENVASAQEEELWQDAPNERLCPSQYEPHKLAISCIDATRMRAEVKATARNCQSTKMSIDPGVRVVKARTESGDAIAIAFAGCSTPGICFHELGNQALAAALAEVSSSTALAPGGNVCPASGRITTLQTGFSLAHVAHREDTAQPALPTTSALAIRHEEFLD